MASAAVEKAPLTDAVARGAAPSAGKEPLTDADARDAEARADEMRCCGVQVRATVRAQAFAGHFAPTKDAKESAGVNADDEVGQAEAWEAKARAEKEYWCGARVRATVRALTFARHFAPSNEGRESAWVHTDDEVCQVPGSRR